MGALYEMVKEAQATGEYETQVITTFEPKIKKSLYMTRAENRDDLGQELKIKIIHYVREYSMDRIPGLFDLE